MKGIIAGITLSLLMAQQVQAVTFKPPGEPAPRSGSTAGSASR